MNDMNDERISRLLRQYAEKIDGWGKKKVAVLGLSFKPDTDDTREAPSTKVIPFLLQHGAEVTGYDPKAMVKFEHFEQSQTIADAVKDAEVIMALIEWPEIHDFDFGTVRDKKKKQWFIDARNQFDPQKIKALGFEYIGVGRS